MIDVISKILNNNGVSFINISNSSGEDKTFVHTFILFLTDKNEVVRLESYGNMDWDNKCGNVLYKTRIVEWNTYKEDLLKLFKINPGVERVQYWNGLFSAHETDDTNFEIDLILQI